MQYTEKPKTIDAVQFRGSKSLYEIEAMLYPLFIQYESTMGKRCELKIQMNKGEDLHTASFNDYIIREYRDAKTHIKVMSSDDFEAQYEQVLFAPAVTVGSDSLARGAAIARGANPQSEHGATLSLAGEHPRMIHPTEGHGEVFNGAAEPKQFTNFYATGEASK